MTNSNQEYLKSLLQAWMASQAGQVPAPVPMPDGVEPQKIRELIEAHNVEVALGPFLPINYHTESFRQSTMAASQRTAFLLMELERILPAITYEGCTPVVLKGAALASTLYRNPLERWFVDLDILVPRSQLEEVYRRLEEKGYRHYAGKRDPQFYERHHFHRILNGPQGSVLEVHWGLTAPNSVYSYDVEGLFDRALPAKIGQVDFLVSAPVDQVLHGVYQNITDGYIDLRRATDMALLMEGLNEEDWLYLMKESRRIRMGTAFQTWLHVVKEILGKEPPCSVPKELVPGWATKRTLHGLNVAGGLLERSAESVDGYTYMLHLLFTPNLANRLREIKRNLLPGEAGFMDNGYGPDEKPTVIKRIHSSLYHLKHLMLSSLRALKALFSGAH